LDRRVSPRYFALQHSLSNREFPQKISTSLQRIVGRSARVLGRGNGPHTVVAAPTITAQVRIDAAGIIGGAGSRDDSTIRKDRRSERPVYRSASGRTCSESPPRWSLKMPRPVAGVVRLLEADRVTGSSVGVEEDADLLTLGDHRPSRRGAVDGVPVRAFGRCRSSAGRLGWQSPLGAAWALPPPPPRPRTLAASQSRHCCGSATATTSIQNASRRWRGSRRI
jgi:hypothetical protein